MSLPRRETDKSLKNPPQRRNTGGARNTHSVSGDSVASQEPTQILDDRYLDRDMLTGYLEERFPGKWKVQVCTTLYIRKEKRALMQHIGQVRPVDDYSTGNDIGCMLLQIPMVVAIWLISGAG
jgi:hypothetical protein